MYCLVSCKRGVLAEHCAVLVNGLQHDICVAAGGEVCTGWVVLFLLTGNAVTRNEYLENIGHTVVFHCREGSGRLAIVDGGLYFKDGSAQLASDIRKRCSGIGASEVGQEEIVRSIGIGGDSTIPTRGNCVGQYLQLLFHLSGCCSGNVAVISDVAAIHNASAAETAARVREGGIELGGHNTIVIGFVAEAHLLVAATYKTNRVVDVHPVCCETGQRRTVQLLVCVTIVECARGLGHLVNRDCHEAASFTCNGSAGQTLHVVKIHNSVARGGVYHETVVEGFPVGLQFTIHGVTIAL